MFVMNRVFILFVFSAFLVSNVNAQFYNIPNAKTKRWQKAQKFKPSYRYWMVGVDVGAATYHGDLNPRNNYTHSHWTSVRPSLGANLTWRYSPRFSFRGGVTYARLHGADQTKSNVSFNEGNVHSEGARYTRNLSFFNNVIELKAEAMADLFENRRNLRSKVQWTPYAAVGVGLIYHNPMAEYKGEKYNLRKLGTEGQLLDGGKTYSSFQFVVPMTVGIRYRINDAIDVALELGARMTFTDYLDDVSGNYVDKRLLGDPSSVESLLSDRSIEKEVHPDIQELAGVRQYTDAEGYSWTESYGGYQDNQPRGNSKDNDWYMITAFHITYIFHPKTYAARYRG